MENRLGKIEKVSFGIQSSRLGLHVTLSSSEGWGTQTSKCLWDFREVKHTEHSQWTEQGRDDEAIILMRYVSKLLKEAKVTDINKLVGIPIEATFDGNTLKSWRILTEVI